MVEGLIEGGRLEPRDIVTTIRTETSPKDCFLERVQVFLQGRRPVCHAERDEGPLHFVSATECASLRITAQICALASLRGTTLALLHRHGCRALRARLIFIRDELSERTGNVSN